MFRKLLFLLLAAVLAWFLGPTLSGLFSAVSPWFKPAAVPLSDYVTGQTNEFYAHVILWTILLFFLLPLVAWLFGGLTPHARRYATTKLSRRIQGVTTELGLLLVLFLVFTVGIGLLSPQAKRRGIHQFTEANLNTNSFGLNLIITRSNALAAASQIYEIDEAYALETNRMAFTNFINSTSWSNAHSDYYTINEDLSTYMYSKSPHLREQYRAFQANHVKLPHQIQEARKWADQLVATFAPGGEYYQKAYEQARAGVAAMHPWRRFVLLPLPTVWGRALFTACLLWFVAHVCFKSEISAIHHVFARFLDEGRFGLGGSGRFAGLFEEWGLISGYQQPGAILSMCLTPVKQQHLGQRFGQWLEKTQRTAHTVKRTEIFLGRSLYNPFLNIGMSGDQHMLTIAPSRTGKGATAIIPNLLLWEGSALVIDPKGTNAAVTAERRRQMGQKVHLVDPFGIVEKDEEARACFNPLAGLDPDSDTIREDIGVIADALVVPDPESKEKHWDDGARTILCGLIGQLITGYENPSLPLLRELLALPQDQQDELWATMFLNYGAGAAPRDAASRIIRGAGTNEISGLISNADKHTEWLSYTAMQKTLSRSTFSFAELKEQPTTIYLILPPEYLGLHNRFLRLFINMAILQMAKGGRSKIPVLMVLDEFLALGHMAEVEKALGLMAGYNLILWPIIQDLARLKDLYKNSVNSFIANSRAVQVFGVTDPQTTEYISKQLGNSAASVLPTGKFSNFVPLRSPDEVSRDIVTNSNRQYILRAGQPPLILEKVPYYKGGLFGGAYPGLFHGKYTPDPDHGA